MFLRIPIFYIWKNMPPIKRKSLYLLKARTYLGCQHLQFFELGVAILSLIGYYFRDWHDMQVCIALMAVPFFVLYFFIPNSPRWFRI